MSEKETIIAMKILDACLDQPQVKKAIQKVHEELVLYGQISKQRVDELLKEALDQSEEHGEG